MPIFRKYPLVPLTQAVWPSALAVPNGATHFLETAYDARLTGAGTDHEGVPYVVALESTEETKRQRVFLQLAENGETVIGGVGFGYIGHFHAPEEPNTYGVFVLAVYGPEWWMVRADAVP